MSSFLSRIKQQQLGDSSSDGLQLIYLLTLPLTDGQVRLTLMVALRQPDGTLADRQPYALRREHLAERPRFLDQQDQQVLNTLVRLEAAWHGRHQGDLPTSLSGAWWHALVATGRACWQVAEGSIATLHWGNPQPCNAEWRLQGDGRQRLCWALSVGQCALPQCEPLWFDQAAGLVGLITHGYSAEAARLVQSCIAVDPAECDRYLAETQAMLQTLQLPLPLVVDVQNVALVPLPCLTFSGVSESAAQLGVSFIYRCPDTGPSSVEWCVNPRDAMLTQTFRVAGRVVRLLRDISYEHQCLLAIKVRDAVSLAEGSYRWVTSAAWQAVMLEEVPQWRAQGWKVSVAADFYFNYVQVERYHWKLMPARHGWFDLELGVMIDGERCELLPLLRQFAARYRLGELAKMPADQLLEATLADGRRVCVAAVRVHRWLSQVVEMLDAAHDGRYVRLAESQLIRFASLLGEIDCEAESNEHNDSLERAARLLRPHPTLDWRLPAEFATTLRDYQCLGVSWLQHLRLHEAGGILADDMGLGKTVQMLAHFALEQQAGRLQTPALVVMPTSLLGNWQAEARRLVPWLRCVVLHGAERYQFMASEQTVNVYFTTYTVLANDIEYWAKKKLSLLVLDEAQAVKNHRTRAARAVRQLDAEQRICLSGTPLENHLGELWALFDFVMPGLLFGEARFQRYYRYPIEKEGDDARLQALLDLIKPFMLRRRKSEVARELPPKTEIIVRVPLLEAQRDLYERMRSQTIETLRAVSNHHESQRFLVLSALNQLRQLCCDPVLIGADDHLPSAKRQRAIEMIKELIEEQRRILVFSQFTRMLDLLAKDLDGLQIPYLMLTGQTRDRSDCVRRFQKSDIPVFLISLKAGGTGLNLVEADIVLHFDPWWNSAAETQASDRAWRIGQDKPVFVYKLITEDTVEEKVLALQEYKLAMLNAVYQAAENTSPLSAIDSAALLTLLDVENG